MTAMINQEVLRVDLSQSGVYRFSIKVRLLKKKAGQPGSVNLLSGFLRLILFI